MRGTLPLGASLVNICRPPRTAPWHCRRRLRTRARAFVRLPLTHLEKLLPGARQAPRRPRAPTAETLPVAPLATLLSVPDQPPRQPGDAQPLEDLWAHMARELAGNSDSPASVKIMSAVTGMLRPGCFAVDQLVQAYSMHIESPGPMADAAVRAAEQHWESACQATLVDETRKRLRDDAAQAVARRRRAPPPVESVVAGLDGHNDMGYDLGLHLQGLRGTWHRLWASIAMGSALGDSPEQRECVATIRRQFESLLGRAL
jgi:hypothetical protein